MTRVVIVKHTTPKHPSAAGLAGTHPIMNLSPEELLDHTTWLRRFAAALVRDSHEADDLAQDALGVLAENRSEVRDVRSFLAGTVRFLALNRHRSTARRRGLETDVTRERSQEAPASDDVTERMDVMRVVLEEVRELPPLQARAIGLRFFDELSTDEIARQEGVSASTVRSNLSRGLAALRERLDRRTGGRDVWCAVLAPWVTPIPIGALPGGESPISAASPKAAGTTAAASGVGALVSTGALLMSAKITGAIVAPVLLFALWSSSQPNTDLERHDVNSTTTLADGPKEGPSITQPAAEGGGRRESTTMLATPPIADSTVEAREAAKDLFPLRGRAVDRATGEPIAGLRVVFSREPESENLSGFCGEALTRADGTFESEDGDFPAGPISVFFTDNADLGSAGYGSSTHEVELPLVTDLEFDLGPTLQLDYVSGPFIEGQRYIVEALPPGADRRTSFSRTITRLAPAPWLRFAAPLKGDGPWTLELSNADGLVVGTGTLASGSGIQAKPVAIQFEARGAIEFRMASAPSGLSRGTLIELSSEAKGPIKPLRLTQKDGGQHGRVGRLQGGLHHWSYSVGDQTHQGTVEVRLGETSHVELDPLGGPRTSANVLIDATAVPEADIAAFDFFVHNKANIEEGFQPTPVRVEGAPAGTWRILLEDLPEAEWMLAAQVKGGFQVDQIVQPIRPGGAETRLVVTELATRAVTIEVVDTAGRTISDRTEAVHVDGIKLNHVNQGRRGTLEPIEVPSARATTFFVRASGYKLKEVAYDPTQDGAIVRVELERGWRGRVFVFDMETLEKIPGVEVVIDGEAAGETGPDGALWFEADGPPSHIELVSDPSGLEVIVSPFDRKDSAPADVLPGYPFLVRRR